MARLTNADRKALAEARAGVVTPEVVKNVLKEAEKVVKKAIAKPTPVVDTSPKPVVTKPARTVKTVEKTVEEPKVAKSEAKNADILGDDVALEDKTVAELRDIASDIDVEGRSKLTKKDDLIDGIKSDDDWKK
jgi:hypothetical protein